LVVLKLEAYRDRHSSARGEKDAKDLIRLALVSAAQGYKFDRSICTSYLNDTHLTLLSQLSRSPHFLSLAKGNAKQAKGMRQKFEKLLEQIMDKADL